MRVIQSAINDVKAIQPSAAQALMALLPPGKHRCLQELEPGPAGPGQAQGQGASALLPGQEKLHQEGKAALRTLSSTREALREAMERELQEQRELRAHCRAFFRSVVLSLQESSACGSPSAKNVQRQKECFLDNTRLFSLLSLSFPVVCVRPSCLFVKTTVSE